MTYQLNKKSLIRFVVSIFIIFHFVAFASWSSPFNFRIRDEFVQWISPYMLWSGLWQSWDMFAPNPVNINAHLEADIKFRDGSQTTWKFPRMDQMGYFDRYMNERFRKWSSDRVRLDSYSTTWENTAQYIARIHQNDLNPPIEIKLKRCWDEIAPPVQNTIYQPHPKEYPHKQRFTFYKYLTKPEDFS